MVLDGLLRRGAKVNSRGTETRELDFAACACLRASSSSTRHELSTPEARMHSIRDLLFLIQSLILD